MIYFLLLGSMYLQECNIQYLIPIYLIVSGVVPILFSGSGRKSNDGETSFGIGELCGLVAFFFHVAWLMCGM